MGKLPYYPLYVNDFDESPRVLAMSLAEVGLYQLAMNEAWKRGSIPDDPKELARLVRREHSDVKRAWPKVRACFVENGTPGRLVSERLESERNRANKTSKARSHAAILSHISRANASANADAIATTNACIRASGSSSSGGFEFKKENGGDENPLYTRYHDLLTQWEHPDGVDNGMRMWIVLVDSGEITSQNIDEVFDGLDRYKASEKYAKGYRKPVDKWLIGRHWKDWPKPVEVDSWGN